MTYSHVSAGSDTLGHMNPFRFPYEQENIFHSSGLQHIHHHLRTFYHYILLFATRTKLLRTENSSFLLPSSSLEGSNARLKNNDFDFIMANEMNFNTTWSSIYVTSTDKSSWLKALRHAMLLKWHTKLVTPPPKLFVGWSNFWWIDAWMSESVQGWHGWRMQGWKEERGNGSE